MSLKAVIFDLGDTLITHNIDSNQLGKKVSKEIHKLFLKKGYVISRNNFHELKTEMWNDWKMQFGLTETEFSMNEFLKNLLYKLELGAKAQGLKELAASIADIIYIYDLKYMVLKPKVKETLDKLKSMSYTMGIITNTSYSYDHIINILKHLKLIDYFKVVLVSSKEKVCKPSPKIFKKALQLLNVSSEEAVFIGNNLQIDIEGAERAGMRGILVENAEERMDKIKQYKPNIAVVKSIAEILLYLEK